MISDLQAHAAALAAFHKALTDAGVGGDVAGVATIDVNKAIISGQVVLPGASKDEKKAELARASEEKARRRAEQLAAS